jgi:hypothetical protein
MSTAKNVNGNGTSNADEKNAKTIAKTAFNDAICSKYTMEQSISIFAACTAIIVLLIYVLFVRKNTDVLDYAVLRYGLIATFVGGLIGVGAHTMCKWTNMSKSDEKNNRE